MYCDVISDANFLKRLSKGRYEASKSDIENFTPLKANNFEIKKIGFRYGTIEVLTKQ